VKIEIIPEGIGLTREGIYFFEIFLSWWLIILIIILTIISAFFIFYRFVDIPKYLSFDEVEFAKLALSLQNKPYTPYSSLATGHSTLYFYIILLSLKTFGVNVFALRFPAAIFGIMSVIMFYLIIKGVFQQLNNGVIKQFLPFFLSLILLSSRWFLNFARFSFEATFLLFLELVSIYFLISKKSLFFSGLFAGFAFLSYTPGRIFFILPIGFIILKWYRRGMSRLYNKIIIKNLLLFLIPFIIIITPLTSYFLTNKDIRIDQQFFLRNREMTVNEKVNGLWNNISSTTLMLFTKGDMNGRHNYPGKPALNPVLGILFIIGLIISIKNFKNLFNKLFLLYFLISLFPAILTYPWENPSMLRTFTVIPSVIYFIGNTIYHLGSIVQRWSINKMFVSCFLLFCFLHIMNFVLILNISQLYLIKHLR